MSSKVKLGDLPSPEQISKKLTVDDLPAYTESPSVAPKTPGMFESFARGAAQGATFDTSDEITGLLESMATNKSYEQARDEARAANKAAAEANPITSFMGNIVGGVATIPLGGAAAKLAGAGLKGAGALKAADLLTKLNELKGIRGAVAGGVGYGAAAGLGGSEGDTVGKNLSDAASGAVVGGLTGGALGLAGKGIGAASEFIGSQPLAQQAKRTFEKGLSGIKTYGKAAQETAAKMNKEAAEATVGALNKEEGAAAEGISKLMPNGDLAAGEVPESLLSKTQEKARRVATADIDNQLEKNSMELDKVKSAAADSMEQQKALAEDIGNAQKEKTNREIVDSAKQLQDRVNNARNGISDTYSKLDSEISKTGIQIENAPHIENFIKTVEESGAPDSVVNAISKKLEAVRGKEDFAGYQKTKELLKSYFEHGDNTVRSAAKKAYAAMNEEMTQTLQNGNFTELADKLAETNKNWAYLKTIEDNFVHTPEKVGLTGNVAQPKTISTIESLRDNTAKNIGSSEEFSNLLKGLMPEESEGILQGLKEPLSPVQKIEPQIPQELVNRQQGLESTIEKLKGQKESVGKFGVNADVSPTEAIKHALDEGTSLTDAQQIFNGVLNKLPEDQQSSAKLLFDRYIATKQAKTGLGITNITPETELKTMANMKDVVSKYEGKSKGADVFNSAIAKLKETNPEMATKLEKQVTEAAQHAMDVGTSEAPGLHKSMLAKVGVSAIPNMAGQVVESVGGKALYDSLITNEGIKKAMSMVPAGGKLYNALANTLTREGTSRQAAVYALLQQPAYREIISRYAEKGGKEYYK